MLRQRILFSVLVVLTAACSNCRTNRSEIPPGTTDTFATAFVPKRIPTCPNFDSIPTRGMASGGATIDTRKTFSSVENVHGTKNGDAIGVAHGLDYYWPIVANGYALKIAFCFRKISFVQGDFIGWGVDKTPLMTSLQQIPLGQGGAFFGNLGEASYDQDTYCLATTAQNKTAKSLQSTPAYLHLVTEDHKSVSEGFETNFVTVCGEPPLDGSNSSLLDPESDPNYDTEPLVISPLDNLDGVVYYGLLLDNNDTVYFKIKADVLASGWTPMTMISLSGVPEENLWEVNVNSGGKFVGHKDSGGIDFNLYAACGRKPTITDYDWSSAKVGSSDEWIKTAYGECQGNYIYIAVHSFRGRGLFKLRATTATDARNVSWSLRIGTFQKMDESSEDYAMFIEGLRQGFRRFYDHSRGHDMITNVKLYNGDWQCGATNGSNCEMLYHPNYVDNGTDDTRARVTHATPTVARHIEMWKPAENKFDVFAATLAHEMGHFFYTLPDEYYDTYDDDTRPNLATSHILCGHTVMGGGINVNTYCHSLDHGLDSSGPENAKNHNNVAGDRIVDAPFASAGQDTRASPNNESWNHFPDYPINVIK